jgi:hydroxymethylbilane synthase
MTSKLRLVTRKSALAIWQANHVKLLLEALYSDLVVSIIGVHTEGDKHLQSPLFKMGGKGLFVKELESYLLENKADIAVHSMKDLPALIPEGLCIGAILQRADPRDVLVTSASLRAEGLETLQTLRPKAVVGSSSLRRQSQVYALRPDVQVKPLRGNVDTRVQKLDKGEFDAIVLAAAGLIRLGLEQRITELIDIAKILPAVGQGALGIECRSMDKSTQALIAPLHHPETGWCVSAERAMNKGLESGCQSPVAGLAEIGPDRLLTLNAWVGTPDGRTMIRMEESGVPEESEAIGESVAKRLLAKGAKEIIGASYV